MGTIPKNHLPLPIFLNILSFFHTYLVLYPPLDPGCAASLTKKSQSHSVDSKPVSIMGWHGLCSLAALELPASVFVDLGSGCPTGTGGVRFIVARMATGSRVASTTPRMHRINLVLQSVAYSIMSETLGTLANGTPNVQKWPTIPLTAHTS